MSSNTEKPLRRERMAAAAAATTKFELHILTRKRDKQVQKNPKIVELRTQQQDIHHHALFFRPPFFIFLSNKEQANLQS